MIIVDTGCLLALLNSEDRHHAVARELFEGEGNRWVVPWAVLPEVDYLAGTRLGRQVARAFLEDLRDGLFRVDANVDLDLPRAAALEKKYAALELGLVDAVVMAQAERHRARAILTTDARHFGTVKLNLQPAPRLPLLEGRR